MKSQEDSYLMKNYSAQKVKQKLTLINERDGKDTSIARITRLFYVAYTQAQKSLADNAIGKNFETILYKMAHYNLA